MGKQIKIAVDPGFSSIKVIIEGILFSMPCDVIENTGNEDKFLSDKKENFAAITIFGKNYLVGNYARKLLLETNRQEVQEVNKSVLEDFERFGSAYFEVSMKAAIGMALVKYCEFSQKNNLKPKVTVEELPECDIYLAIAVPQEVFARGNKGPVGVIKQRLYDTHEFTLELADATYELKFTINKKCPYRFQSQVVAALLGTLEDEFETEMDILDTDDTQKPILCIDGGYKTVGIFKLSQIDTVEEAESNSSFAMAVADEKVARIMAERGRSDIKSYNIQEYYDSETEIAVVDDGETHYVTVNADRDEAIAENCNIMIDYLREKYNNLLPIKQILVTGGTGAAFFPTFEKYIYERPDMKHLRGRIKLAQYKFYGQDIIPMYAIVCGLYKQFTRYLNSVIEEQAKPNPQVKKNNNNGNNGNRASKEE